MHLQKKWTAKKGLGLSVAKIICTKKAIIFPKLFHDNFLFVEQRCFVHSFAIGLASRTTLFIMQRGYLASSPMKCFAGLQNLI